MVYPNNWENAVCSDWCEDKDKMWLCMRDRNAICEIDKMSKEAKILGSFPHNVLGETDLSLSSVRSGDYVVFCPFKANDVAMLNIATGKLEFIDFRQFTDRSEYKGGEVKKFYRMAVYKNFILFFGIKYPLIMRLNLITKKLDFFDDWLEIVGRHKGRETIFFTDGYAQRGNEIYLPLGRCSGILKVNLDTMVFDYLKLGLAGCGILGMTHQEGYAWLTVHDMSANCFFQWDLDKNEIIQIGLPGKDAYYAPLYYRKSLLFFQNYGKKSYQYELETGRWNDITERMHEVAHSGDKKVRGEEIVYFSRRGKFYHWNPQTDAVYFDEFKIQDSLFLESTWMNYWEQCKREAIKEGNLTLRDYLEVIGSCEMGTQDEKERIYDISSFGKKELKNGELIWKLLNITER